MIERKTASQCISSEYCRGWNDAVEETKNLLNELKEKCSNCTTCAECKEKQRGFHDFCVETFDIAPCRFVKE